MSNMPSTDDIKVKVAPAAKEDAPALIDKLATPGADTSALIDKMTAPGADSIVPTHQNGSADPKKHDPDYEIVSEIPSVAVTMERPAYKPRGGLKEAGTPTLLQASHDIQLTILRNTKSQHRSFGRTPTRNHAGRLCEEA